MMKDIQENMNNLYDGPFNSGSMLGQRSGVGNAQQGKTEIKIYKWCHQQISMFQKSQLGNYA